MTVKDDSDFLSVYSVTDTPVISSEVAQFLEHSIQDLMRPEHLTLIIKSNCIDDIEKELYRKGIANHSLRRDVRRYEALENMQVEYEEDIQ
ncbi:MAG: hypothetical protein LUC90_04080 [Lachnospiraceae bacterium]|nr:hypothetical protein [Lachnospiraceae bacterium]